MGTSQARYTRYIGGFDSESLATAFMSCVVML
jgi:hypothetical protein